MVTALRTLIRAALVAGTLALAAATHAAERLPALATELAGTSVSGISSGGFMAVQFHVAHSGIVRGAGVIAGGPYYCAEGSVTRAMFNCMRPGSFTPLPATDVLKAFATSFAAANRIDPTANLAGARVWLFTGSKDTTVMPDVVAAARRFYLAFAPPANVVLVDTVPAGHAMITFDAGKACDVTQAPFINDCDFDAAGELLAHIYGPLAAASAKAGGRVVAFDQREFAGGDAFAVSLADTGFAYVPQACEAGGCRVHVAFHGCKQAHEAIGDRFVRESGYSRWADANRLVILFPQTIARSGWAGWWGGSFVFNPNGCWDWWGYTGPGYATKAGPQIRAVRAMIGRLAEPKR
jgi:poly(3-hydroxybutyrate) depolymerase